MSRVQTTLVWLSATLLVMAPAAASAKEEVFGFSDPNNPATAVRVGNGAEYIWNETYNLPDDSTYQPRMIADSSLPGTLWWTSSSNTDPWPTNRWQNANEADDHPAVQFTDQLEAGDSFWFGYSYDRAIQGSRNDFREVSRSLPTGSQIYIGYSLNGLPNGVTFAYEDGSSNANQVGLNAPDLAKFATTVPAGLDPAEVLAAYSWLEYVKTGSDNQTVVRIDLDEVSGQELAATEILYYVVIPDDFAGNIPTGSDPDGARATQGLTFTWTVDARGGDVFDDEFGDENPNYGNILNEVVPEPGRAVLLTLAFVGLLLRRSRPRR